MSIPRVIHQIWVGGAPPDWFWLFTETWQRHHPDWEYVRWTDENRPELRNEHLYGDAENLVAPQCVGQFRADLLRYEILHQHGGMYVDGDFECLAPIDDHIDDVPAFAAWEVDGQWIANGLMGAQPGHPLLDALIDGMDDSVVANPDSRPSKISGPQYLTRLWRETGGTKHDMRIIPSRFVYPYLHSDVGTRKAEPPWPEECIAVHHWNGIRTRKPHLPAITA